MKIVLIGAGSRIFGRGQVVDVLLAEDLRGRGVHLVLVDTNPDALDAMRRFAERVKTHLGADIGIEAIANRRTALQGADYVLTAVSRHRLALWEQDFRVPLAHGFRHCLGENGGPGAIFHALRSFELILPICRDIEAACPDALLLNFTNPEARVLYAIGHLTRVKALGLCHGVFSGLDLACRLLGRRPDDLDIVTAGINHFYIAVTVRDRRTGADLLPELLDRTLAQPPGAVPPLFRKFAEIFRVFIFPSDGHIGEYVSWGAEFSGMKWHYAGRECRPVPLIEPTPTNPIEEWAAGRRPLAEALRPSGESAIDLIKAIELKRDAWIPAVNTLNTGRLIENLPEDAPVEVPARIDAGRIIPQKVGPLPEPFAAMIRTQCTIIALLTEGYRTRSRRLLLEALLLDPCVNSIQAAEQLLDEMLELQKDYLPTFS